MKKSKSIVLTLMVGMLLSCSQEQPKKLERKNQVHMRSDSTAPYHTSPRYHSSGYAPIFIHAFHSGGYWAGNSYNRSGYHNSQLPHSSNVGTNHTKSSSSYTPTRSTVRSGFGGTGRSHSVTS